MGSQSKPAQENGNQAEAEIKEVSFELQGNLDIRAVMKVGEAHTRVYFRGFHQDICNGKFMRYLGNSWFFGHEGGNHHFYLVKFADGLLASITRAIDGEIVESVEVYGNPTQEELDEIDALFPLAAVAN